MIEDVADAFAALLSRRIDFRDYALLLLVAAPMSALLLCAFGTKLVRLVEVVGKPKRVATWAILATTSHVLILVALAAALKMRLLYERSIIDIGLVGMVLVLEILVILFTIFLLTYQRRNVRQAAVALMALAIAGGVANLTKDIPASNSGDAERVRNFTRLIRDTAQRHEIGDTEVVITHDVRIGYAAAVWRPLQPSTVYLAEAALARFDDDALSAIAIHELGHIKNRDSLAYSTLLLFLSASVGIVLYVLKRRTPAGVPSAAWVVRVATSLLSMCWLAVLVVQFRNFEAEVAADKFVVKCEMGKALATVLPLGSYHATNIFDALKYPTTYGRQRLLRNDYR